MSKSIENIFLLITELLIENVKREANKIKHDSNTDEKTPNEPEILANDIFETVDQSETNSIDLNEAELNIETRNSKLNIESERIENQNSNVRSSKDSIILTLPKSYSSHKCCIICFKNNLYVKLHIIQSETRVQTRIFIYNTTLVQTMISKSIFIPDQCRTCHSQLQGKRFKKEALDLIVSFNNEEKMDSKSVKDLLSSLIEASKKKSLFDDFAYLNSIYEETCI
ncbi:unnamed protein product [Brachionus calyciflorus]|uniref:Uncharacterized protein n=1 Tax=Brachionus calyciflorus TaxID=104777 RepID=A0A814MDV5_9BILA|nr:unnamed protein product [Brachionus calyciflorus]